MKYRETFVNLDKGCRFGESEWMESPYGDDAGALFRAMRAEYGRCTSKVYRDKKGGRTVACGWTFQKRMRYEDARTNKPSDYYTREVWIHLADSVETVVKEHAIN